MDTVAGRPHAEAALAWAADMAAQNPERGYAGGLGHGLLVGLALARLDPEWATAALDQLLEVQHDRLAARLAATPGAAPGMAAHRLALFGQAQEVLRGSAALGAHS